MCLIRTTLHSTGIQTRLARADVRSTFTTDKVAICHFIVLICLLEHVYSLYRIESKYMLDLEMLK